MTRTFLLTAMWTSVWCSFAYVSTTSVARALNSKRPSTVIRSADVAKPLAAAQVDIRRGAWAAALQNIEQAQSFTNKTEHDEYNINALLGYVLYRQYKYEQAASVYERLLDSPLLPGTQFSERTKAIADMYFRAGNYSKAAKWAKRILEKNPGNEQAVEMLADSYFRLNDYKSASATMTNMVEHSENTGQIPMERWLRLMDYAYYRLSDNAGRERALLLLVLHFQKMDDWSELINLSSQDVHDERVALGYHVLMFELGVLNRADDYEDTIFEALETGIPGEAAKVLDRAKTHAIFTGPDSAPDRYERISRAVDNNVAKVRAALPRIAASAAASEAGQSDVSVGSIYLSFDQYEQAIAAINRGLIKGRVEDVDKSRIDLGIAYLKTGKLLLASQELQAVDKDSKWAQLAELWILRADRTSQSG